MWFSQIIVTLSNCLYIFFELFQIMSRKFRNEQLKLRQLNAEVQEELDRVKLQREKIFAPIIWRDIPDLNLQIQDLKVPMFEESIKLIEVWVHIFSSFMYFWFYRNIFLMKTYFVETLIWARIQTQWSLFLMLFDSIWSTDSRLLW